MTPTTSTPFTATPRVRPLVLLYTVVMLLLGALLGGAVVRGAEVETTSTILGVPVEILDASAFRAYITQWEGCSYVPVHRGASRYARGETTVGIGHNTAFGMSIVDGYQAHRRYTPREVTVLFDADYASAIAACRSQLPHYDALPQSARFVCLSLAWCCGPTGYSQWTSLNLALSHHMYSVAACELMASKWAHQVSSDRLTDHWRRLDGLR